MQDHDLTRKVLYSGFRFSHHNPGSGYDGIVNDQRHYVCGNKFPFGTRPETSRLRKINFILVDLVTLFRGFGYSTIHYIYPENTAYLSPTILRCLGKKIVYTLHLAEYHWTSPARTPFGWMKRRCLTQAADTIITLSLDQALNLRKVFPRKQVHFVPHGLDMAIPAQEDEMFGKRREQLKIVVVGSNYRNFDMLERIVDTRASRRATFHLVGLDDKNRKRFQGVTGVVCHDRLNSEQYEDLLRSSFVMALPLTFATANNALLEAHKFCLPSLCSDIPGVTDYATGSTLFFDQPAAFWRVFDQLAQLNSSAYREMCVRIHREACARFSWEKVRQQIEDYYLN